jgi:hypothetical protein
MELLMCNSGKREVEHVIGIDIAGCPSFSATDAFIFSKREQMRVVKFSN